LRPRYGLCRPLLARGTLRSAAQRMLFTQLCGAEALSVRNRRCVGRIPDATSRRERHRFPQYQRGGPPNVNQQLRF
jgi:hypothetical protein